MRSVVLGLGLLLNPLCNCRPGWKTYASPVFQVISSCFPVSRFLTHMPLWSPPPSSRHIWYLQPPSLSVWLPILVLAPTVIMATLVLYGNFLSIEYSMG